MKILIKINWKSTEAVDEERWGGGGRGGEELA